MSSVDAYYHVMKLLFFKDNDENLYYATTKYNVTNS
jgi:hypothetical protein